MTMASTASILVDEPQDADVILILGSNAPKTSLDDYARAAGED